MRTLLLLGLATGLATSTLTAQTGTTPPSKTTTTVAPAGPQCSSGKDCACCQGMKDSAGGKGGMMGGGMMGGGMMSGGMGGGMMGGMHQGGGMMGGMGAEGGGMAGVPGPLRPFMAFEPSAVLAMNDMLELSADQAAKLATLAETAKKAEESAHAPAMAAMKSLQDELAKPTPNADAVRQYLTAHAAAEGNMQWIRLKANLDARALLSAEQRKHVEEMGQGGMAGHQHAPQKP